jgi:hypothetical protein
MTSETKIINETWPTNDTDRKKLCCFEYRAEILK